MGGGGGMFVQMVATPVLDEFELPPLYLFFTNFNLLSLYLVQAIAFSAYV